jgi:hypothetical protein
MPFEFLVSTNTEIVTRSFDGFELAREFSREVSG